jgi:hypothetical protein
LTGDLADMGAGVIRVVWRAAPVRSDDRHSAWRAAGVAWLPELANAYSAPERSAVDR